MKNIVELDGSAIKSEKDFHDQISRILEFPSHYGRNLDALWDCLSGEINTDIRLVWKSHADCKKALGTKFDDIVKILNELKNDCNDFEFTLE